MRRWKAALACVALAACRGGPAAPADAPPPGAAETDGGEAAAPPGEPKETGAKGSPGAVLKGRVYAVALDAVTPAIVYAGAAAGVVIYDVKDPSAPAELSTVFLPGSVMSIVQEKNLLYAATGPAGVAVIDVTSKAEPAVRRVIGTPGGAWKAVPAGPGLIAVADGSMGVSIVDAAGPGAPTVVARWGTKDYVRDVAVEIDGKRRFVYGACGIQGLALLELKPSGGLSELAVLKTEGDVRHLALSGSTVFAAAGEKGLLIARRNGDALVGVGGFDPVAADLARGVCVSPDGSRAFLTAGEHGLVFLDVSDPAAVKVLGTYDHDTSLNRMVLGGTLAIVAADAGGLLLLDVSSIPDVKVLFPAPSPSGG
jgi:hypothetical protein